jgi:hypothetical protein
MEGMVVMNKRADLDSVVPNKTPEPLAFENRVEDLRIIRGLSPNLNSTKGDYPDYLIISAPAGYGKTRLLYEVKNWFDKGYYKEQYSGKWKCLLVNLADFPNNDLTTSCKKIALSFLRNLGDPATQDELFGLEGVATLINRQNLNTFLIFDNVESNRDLVKCLNDDDGLLDLRIRVRRELQIRIVYAGRYISANELNLKRPFEANVIKLSSLEISAVARMVAENSERASETEWIDIVARTILFLSGGVPKIIESIIQTFNNRSWNIGLKRGFLKESDLRGMYHACQHEIATVVEEILKDIQTPKLRNAMEALCVFRQYDFSVFRKLQAEIPEIVDETIKHDFLGYDGKLVVSGLIQPPSNKFQRYVYSDGPILKLLRVKPYFENRNDYNKLHKWAYDVYRDLTEGNGLSNPLDIQYLVERIYHFIMNHKPTKTELLKEMGACLALCKPLISGLREMFVSFLKEDEEICYRLQELFGKGDINSVIGNKLMMDLKDRPDSDVVEPIDVRPEREKIQASQTVNRKLRVFLCHASEDRLAVRNFKKRFMNTDWIDPWLDEEKLLPGQDWQLEIEKAVETSDAVIVFLSGKSVHKEGFVQRELRYILDIALEKPEGTIFIIPLKLDDCEIPRRVRSIHWMNYFPKGYRADAFKKIIQSLEERRKKLGI